MERKDKYILVVLKVFASLMYTPVLYLPLQGKG